MFSNTGHHNYKTIEQSNTPKKTIPYFPLQIIIIAITLKRYSTDYTRNCIRILSLDYDRCNQTTVY